ncbi:MAG: RHS repeat-associated core domain-containing protein [Candidatus Polarisedimenticolia bacterium]
MKLILVFGCCLVMTAPICAEEILLRRDAPSGLNPPALEMFVDAVAPFVTNARRSPAILDVPRDVTLELRAVSDRPAQFLWEGAKGARSQEHGSTASRRFPKPGRYVIRVTAVFDAATQVPRLERTLVVRVGPERASGIRIRMVNPAVGGTEIGTRRSARVCRASISHPQYTHLVEWRTLDGSADPGIGLTWAPTFRRVGIHPVQVGNDRTQAAVFETFDVARVDRSGPYGEMIWYDFPITFRASTVPVGYERHVSWKVDTHHDMFTRAEPSSGTGGQFTTVFRMSGADRLFWAMVYASEVEAFDNPDQLPPQQSVNSGLEAPNDAGQSSLNLARLPVNVNAGSVYLHSGEYRFSEVVLRIPGRGFDFVWGMTHRSREGRLTAMGNNWDHSYNIRVEVNLLNPTQRWLYDGHGRRDTYSPVGGNCWASNGFFAELCLQPDLKYTLTLLDRTVWTMKAIDGTLTAGKILEIRDRNQNAMTFGYDGSGRLATIVDTLDRIIQVTSTGTFIQSVNDFRGRVVQFAFYQAGDAGGDAGDLKSWTTPAVTGTPNGNDFPAGKTTTCTYSKGFVDPALNHNLLTITDPRGLVIVQNQYQTSGFPTDIVNGMLFPNGRVTFYYVGQVPGPGNDMATVKTIVKDRAGNVREALFNARNELVLLKEYTGRAPDLTSTVTESLNRPVAKLRPGDPGVYQTHFAFNPDSMLKRIDYPRGNVTLMNYEVDVNPTPLRRSRGNLRVRTRQPGTAGGDQSSIVDSWQYDPNFNMVVQYVDGRGHPTIHSLDASGNRIQTQHRIPTILENWEVNAFGQVTAHILPDNGSGWRRRDEFAYYTSGSQRGYLESSTLDALGRALLTGYSWNPSGALIALVDAKGNDTAFDVNALDQVVRETSREVAPESGVRYVTDSFYDAANNLVRRDVRNVDEDGVLQPNQDFTTTYERDALNRMTAVVQEVDETRSIRTEFGYDVNDHQSLIRRGEATAGRIPADTLTTLYDERDFVFREIQAQGATEQSTSQRDYDLNGNPSRVSEGLEASPHVSSVVCDGFDRAITSVDPMGNVSRLRYDANGNVVSQRVEGELVDLPGSTANVRLREAFTTYDFLDRPIREDEAFFNRQTQAPVGDGMSSTITDYTGMSAVARIEDDNGHAILRIYDTTGELAETTDAEGNIIAFLYDENLNVVTREETDTCDLGGPEDRFSTTYILDGLDRVIQMVDSSGNVFDYAYDSRGNEARTSDGARAAPELPGNIVTHEYDGANRQTSTTMVLTNDGTGGGTPVGSIGLGQTWDDSGRIASQIDANGRATSYQYDPLGRVTRMTMADGTFSTTVYDVHDHEVQVTQANGTSLTSVYDDLGGMTSRTIVPGPGVSADTTFETYQYDGDSHVVRAENNNAIVLRSYDSLWNVTAETLNGVTTTFTRDGKGNQTGAVYPGGRSLSTTYDGNDRKVDISDAAGLVAIYAYIGPTRVQRRTLRNGTITTYAYDGKVGVPNPGGDFGVKYPVRMTHQRTAPPLVIDDRSFEWNRTGSRTEQKDLRVGSPRRATRYDYDSAYRLAQAQDFDPNGILLRDSPYTLDGAGNRLTVGGPGGGTYTRSPATPSPADAQVNQYTSTPFDARTYDDNGDLKTMTPAGPGGVRSLTFDYAGRLVGYQDAGTGTTLHLFYDPFGRRIRRTVTGAGTADTRFFFDEWQEIEEQNSAGATQATYVYGNNIDEVLNMERSGASYFYHGDDLDGTRAVTDATGTVVERYDYGDFGQPVFMNAAGTPIPGSAIGNPFLFAGRRYDPVTGLYDYRKRQFDPMTGRFVTRDPTGPWGDDQNEGNPYTYAGNTPWTLIDPTGEAALEPTWAKDPNGVATCSPGQQATAWAATNKAQSLAREAARRLGSLKPRERWCDDGYRLWFGNYSKTRFRTVRRVFDEVRLWLDTQNVPLNCETPCTKMIDGQEANAHTDFAPGSTIHLCQPFFGSLYESNAFAQIGDQDADGQRGAGLIHEMTHWYGTNVSQHERYGPGECLRFAQSHPIMATRNAQNYALYTISPLQGGCGAVDVWSKSLVNVVRGAAGYVAKSAQRAGEKVSNAAKRIKKKIKKWF